MHRGSPFGLGDEQGRSRRLAGFRGGRAPAGAQDAQPRGGAPTAQSGIAQEHELPGLHPVEQGEAFRGLGGRRGAGRRGGGRLAQAAAHRLPVVHGDAHVVERGTQFILESRQGGRVQCPVEFDQLPRFLRAMSARVCGREPGDPALPVAVDLEHGVDQQPDPQARALQHHPQRVDQERHVVGDHGQQAGRACEAVARRIGVEDPDEGLPAPSPRAQPEVGLGDEAQLAGRAGARSARCGSDDGFDQSKPLTRDLMRHGVASKAARTTTVYSHGSTADIGVL